MTLSTTFRANRQRVTDTSGVLVLLEITHPQFSAPFLLANDTQSWTSQGKTYVGYPFELQLPGDNQGETPQAQLRIDNLGGVMTDELDGLTPGDIVQARIILADRSTPDVHEITIIEPMVSVSATPEEITATVGMDYLMRRSAILMRHDPATSPGVFA